VGQTYDEWNGQSWETSEPATGPHVTKVETGSPFEIPLGSDQQSDPSTATTDVQTFYLAQSGPNLVFHADNAVRVYLQSQAIFLTGDGTIVSSASMGAGTVYTVVSANNTATASQLRAATVPLPPGDPPAPALSSTQQARYLQLPHPYPQVAALADQITGRTSATGGSATASTYNDVEAIEAWMARNIKYTTDIPPLAPGADAVNSFLFGSRLGFCEQISTATVVMLRSLGIPARETVGYVPGPYNPITDLYDVQAKDAHAWVQVWFPGYGWQNFDPTANVPLANPSPGSVLAHRASTLVAHLPWIPIVIVVVVMALVVELRRRRRGRPATWAHQIAADLERRGARLERRRRPDETLSAYGDRLAMADPAHGEQIVAVTGLVERYTYGGMEPSAEQIAEALAFTRRFRRERGRPGASGGPPPPTDPAGQPLAAASASSKEAPAASRGR
jgi:hypothetical protein